MTKARRWQVLLTTASIFSSCAQLCYAQLGRPLEVFSAKCGNPISTDIDATLPGKPMSYVFDKNGYYILITVVHGVVAQEQYSKHDGSGLSDNDIETILKANGPTILWKKADAQELWNRADGAVAVYITGSSEAHFGKTIDTQVINSVSACLLLESKCFRELKVKRSARGIQSDQP